MIQENKMILRILDIIAGIRLGWQKLVQISNKLLDRLGEKS